MLNTDRLLIRPARAEDAGDLFEVYGDAETMRYWDSPPDQDVPVTAKRVVGMMRAEPQTYFVLEHEGRAVGTAGVHQDAEIGFILHRAHWRKGLMREALTVLIPWLFDTLNTDTLTADADPRNEGSVGLLKAVGFQVTGTAKNTFCVDGVWTDSVYLALARDAFAR
ncbi:GNAT family N-acetyltransferase [uncultured Litoreibacter sp.]|uniref:GNAT family N-acetyltransferase n=1 Tax=uncultured Litoreibacter sp. TaxID=1392394 RepID=UPI002624CEA8|nr:GNAT family N-acetyltransferase [uncultured Litoreibacter sp.]